MSGRFVFLDRDGTLVRDRGYTHRVEDYALLPGVVPALRRLVEAGYGLAIVTNQSGIGRGLFPLEDYERFERHLEHDLAAQGVPIAGSFFCPHAPDAGCT
ncbi:MAG: HAD-IIIA family hydrolase, partial [Myxococcota bacterium]